MTEELQNLTKALIAAQAEFGAVVKDKTAEAGKFKYKYADLGSVLEAVTVPLAKNGLVLIHAPQWVDGRQLLEARLIHESGEWISATWELPTGATPQQMGSALTYGRRYTATALLGITAEEDDDGNAAEKTKGPPKTRQQPPQPKSAPLPQTAPKKQITLMRALDASETHFPATKAGAVAALQALDVMIEESMDNWTANREVALRIMTTAPSEIIGGLTISDHVTELVQRMEGPMP